MGPQVWPTSKKNNIFQKENQFLFEGQPAVFLLAGQRFFCLLAVFKIFFLPAGRFIFFGRLVFSRRSEGLKIPRVSKFHKKFWARDPRFLIINFFYRARVYACDRRSTGEILYAFGRGRRSTRESIYN